MRMQVSTQDRTQVQPTRNARDLPYSNECAGSQMITVLRGPAVDGRG